MTFLGRKKNVGLNKELLHFGVTEKAGCHFLLVEVHREPECVRSCASNVFISTETVLLRVP